MVNNDATRWGWGWGGVGCVRSPMPTNSFPVLLGPFVYAQAELGISSEAPGVLKNASSDNLTEVSSRTTDKRPKVKRIACNRFPLTQ